jgi:ribonuclease P protein component
VQLCVRRLTYQTHSVKECIQFSILPLSRRIRRETDIPTQRSGAQAPSWLPCPHGDCWRPQCAAQPSCQGACSPVGLGFMKAANNTALVPLTRRSDFVRATKQGRSTPMPGFILQVLPLPEAIMPGVYRVGFTASRKFSKRAVDRNRAKRRLRALAQSDLPHQAAPGQAYVFIARRAILERPFAELRRDLRRALQRLAQPRPPVQQDAPDHGRGHETGCEITTTC